jgi:hypothetical protein
MNTSHPEYNDPHRPALAQHEMQYSREVPYHSDGTQTQNPYFSAMPPTYHHFPPQQSYPEQFGPWNQYPPPHHTTNFPYTLPPHSHFYAPPTTNPTTQVLAHPPTNQQQQQHPHQPPPDHNRNYEQHDRHHHYQDNGKNNK